MIRSFSEWPDSCESVVSPVCKFIIYNEIERHDIGGEALRDVIPIGLCERSGCDCFFMIERAGRGRFGQLQMSGGRLSR